MSVQTENQPSTWGAGQWAGAVLLWLWVAVPFGYGLYQLFIRIPALFGS